MYLPSADILRVSLVWFLLQEMAGPMVEGNDPLTGHIISTTIGGKNGEPKRVGAESYSFKIFIYCIDTFGLMFPSVDTFDYLHL